MQPADQDLLGQVGQGLRQRGGRPQPVQVEPVKHQQPDDQRRIGRRGHGQRVVRRAQARQAEQARQDIEIAAGQRPRRLLLRRPQQVPLEVAHTPGLEPQVVGRFGQPIGDQRHPGLARQVLDRRPGIERRQGHVQLQERDHRQPGQARIVRRSDPRQRELVAAGMQLRDAARGRRLHRHTGWQLDRTERPAEHVGDRTEQGRGIHVHEQAAGPPLLDQAAVEQRPAEQQAGDAGTRRWRGPALPLLPAEDEFQAHRFDRAIDHRLAGEMDLRRLRRHQALDQRDATAGRTGGRHGRGFVDWPAIRAGTPVFPGSARRSMAQPGGNAAAPN